MAGVERSPAGQNSDSTNRNHVRPQARVRLLAKPKPNSCTESLAVNMAGIREKERVSTRGGLAGGKGGKKRYPGDSNERLGAEP